MNHYGPREMKGGDGQPAGRWHYTIRNERDPGPMPIGYCALGCPGHDTPEGACDHYKEYLLDSALRFDDGAGGDTQHKCRVCEAWTTGYAWVDMRHFPLCADHRTREAVAGLLTVGEAWGSY